MPNHPYYPLDANVVGYEPNQTPVLELLLSAGGACTVLLGVTFALASYVRPKLHLADRIAILWFVLCTIVLSKPFPERDADKKQPAACTASSRAIS